MSQNGKGDRQRPCDKRKFDEGYDRIFRQRRGQYKDRIPAEEVFMEDKWMEHMLRLLRKLTLRCGHCDDRLSYTGGELDGRACIRGWCTTCMIYPFDMYQGENPVSHKLYKLKKKGGPSGGTG